MLRRRVILLLILFFLSEGLMLAVSIFLVHRYEHVQPLILGLFLFCILLGAALMKTLTEVIRRDASMQAVEKLRDMEIEQLAALVQTGETMDGLRDHLTDDPEIIQDLEQELPSLYVSRCENPIVDAILFRKSREMKEQDIRCQLRASLPEDLKLDPAVVLSLFTNLLDNAAQAASLCPPEQRFVKLDATLHRNCLVCTCENSVSRQAAITPGRSSRTEPGHGQGLQILEDLCRQYSGGLTGGIEDGCCRLIAVLWIQADA
ncbi:sensor histidine kinase [Faecalibaculum rodentium]|uniref:sensor histidine kinase n=1 Tax=Faecalibaculum rodentium TaxID=1702221 RepID=UPI0023F2FE18|nr:GHKL domain-containing protein [Faecalibaculum rodentium]